MKEWGWTNPVLVDAAGGVIAGHARILAARQLGYGEVPIGFMACPTLMLVLVRSTRFAGRIDPRN
jgi:hypothetical protein